MKPLICLLLSTTASGCAQGLGGEVPGFQRNIYRFLAQSLCALPFLLVRKQDWRIKREVVPYMLMNCVAYSVFNWTY